MKHIIYIILSSALLLACSGNGAPFGYDAIDPVTPTPGPTPTLSLDYDNWTFPAKGGSTHISLTCNVTWRLEDSSCPQWLSVSLQQGSGNAYLLLTAQENTTTSTRQGTLRFVTTDGSNLVAQLQVTQEAGDTPPEPEPTLTVSESPLTFTADQDSRSIGIEGNDNWTASVTHLNGAGWCSVSSYSGTAPGSLTISVTANDDTAERNATVTISGTKTGKTFTISVKQEGKSVTPQPVEASISADPSQLTFDSDPTTRQYVSVTCNKDWSYSSDQTWCNVEGKTSSGFYVRLDRNTTISRRTAVITLTCEDKQCTVTVTQNAASIGRNEYE